MSDTTTPAGAELARQRQHRARAAEVLLKLARENNLASPGVWGWNELALVPQWSFLDAAELLHMQRVAGAVFLSPQLARCIDGRVLNVISSSIGSSLLQKLLDDTEAIGKRHGETMRDAATVADKANTKGRLSAPDAEFANHSPFDFPGAGVNEIGSQVDSLLRKTGSAVLMATVAPGLPADIFVTLLGPVAGALPDAVGLKVIEQAMQLIAEVPRDAADCKAAAEFDVELTCDQVCEQTQAGQMRSGSELLTADEVSVPESQDQPALETA